jgi:acetyltransferase-like isoleucine patch superfamily enzyme
VSIKGTIKRYLSLAGKLRFRLLRNGWQRAEYLRRHDCLASIGSNVYYYSRIFPSDPKLLKLGDNVVICTDVRFVGHDRVDIMLSGMYGAKYTKFYEPIEVGSNVFIGSDTVILPGVKIGDNTVIGAGAVVTKDLPSGYLWGGVPARSIGVFRDFVDKRKDNIHPETDPERLWEMFYAKHGEESGT